MRHTENAAVSLLRRNLAIRPDKAAYRTSGGDVSYRRLAEDAARFAARLRAAGVEPGGAAVLAVADADGLPAAFLGCLLAGVAAVPVSPALPEADIAFIASDCGAAALAGDPAVLPEGLRTAARTFLAAPRAAPLPAPADAPASLDARTVETAFLLYTSGSTGHPKGVPHSHADLLAPESTFGLIAGLDEGDVLLCPSRMSFGYGLQWSLTLCLAAGATAVLLPEERGPAAVLAAMERERPSVLAAVPSLYAYLLRAGGVAGGAARLARCFSSGEPLSDALAAAWRRHAGVEICDGLGASESFVTFLSNRPGRIVPASAGEPAPGYEVRVVDEFGRETPHGPGRLQARGPGAARSYLNRPEASARTFLPDDWIDTGDVCRREGASFFHMGRGDDMFKVAGQWIAPEAVEQALAGHPAVAECAVAAGVGAGEPRAVAFVVAAGGRAVGPDLALELRRHARELLPPHMRPARYIFRGELPRTPTGKLQRFRLLAEVGRPGPQPATQENPPCP